MRDPYEVLGVSRDATDDQIKAAYREKARKFHPDNFHDNPAAAEMATEKMQEINQAYDTITKHRKNKASGGSGYQNNWGAGSEKAGSNFNDVRRLISSGRFEEAQEILDGVPPENRDAEWYFLNGVVLYRRGWFDAAFTNMNNAVRMDPTNAEYLDLLDRIEHGGDAYRRQAGNFTGFSGNSVCPSLCLCYFAQLFCCRGRFFCC